MHACIVVGIVFGPTTQDQLGTDCSTITASFMPPRELEVGGAVTGHHCRTLRPSQHLMISFIPSRYILKMC